MWVGYVPVMLAEAAVAMARLACLLQQALRPRLAAAFEWNYGTRDLREGHVLKPQRGEPCNPCNLVPY